MANSIADLRIEYSAQTLLEQDVAADPVQQFSRWWQQVISSEVVEPNAMTVATTAADGTPDARIVLLKGFDERGFVFYTNYDSAKGRQLRQNPHAALVFFWKELERQVRITGGVEKLSAEESDQYFHSRPTGSQLGAVASPQSQVVESREWLDAHYKTLAAQLGQGLIERPAHWGGYRVKPSMVEFWQGRPSRLHDRIRYTSEANSQWRIERLAP